MFHLFPSIWLPYEAAYGSYPHLLTFLLIIMPTCNLTCINTLSMLPVSIYPSLWSNTQVSQLKWEKINLGVTFLRSHPLWWYEHSMASSSYHSWWEAEKMSAPAGKLSLLFYLLPQTLGCCYQLSWQIFQP